MAIALQILGPHILERGIDSVLEARPDGNALLSTVKATVFDAGGVLVGTYSTTNTRSVALTVPAADTTGRDLSDLWRVEWTVDGRVQRAACHLVRTGWTPGIIDQDLYDEVEALDPEGPNPITSRTDGYARERNRAAREIQQALINKGERPWQVFDPSALRIPHLMLSLAKVFDGQYARDQRPETKANADHYRELYRAAWSDLTILIDHDEDGEADSGARASAVGVTWLCSV